MEKQVNRKIYQKFSLNEKKEKITKLREEKRFYSLHCRRLRSSSTVLFKTTLSDADSTAETGRQTITLPR
jgi:hypothetical protein